MKTEYTDKAGIKHDVEILQKFHGNELVHVVRQDGDHFLDLVRDEDRWIELFAGSSDRADEYGRLIDKLTVITRRS